MLGAVQMLFLAGLLGAVAWLVYLARQQDAAAAADLPDPSERRRLPSRGFSGFRRP
jgi:hypothetical protein